VSAESLFFGIYNYYLNLSDGQDLIPTPSGCAPQGYFAFSIPLAGPVSANLTERMCGSSTQASVLFPIPVYPDPVLAPVTSSFNGTPTSSADQGQSAQFSVSGTEGAPPYSFSWTGLPAQGCTVAPGNGTSVATCTHLAMNTTGLKVQATLTDNNSFSVTSPVLTFPVLPDPTVSTPRAQGPSGSATSGDTGQVVTFETGATGGSGIYPTFLWTGLPPGECWDITTATVHCLLGSPSSSPAQVRVAVRDSNGFTSSPSQPLTFAVHPAPSATPPVALLAGEATDSADVGQGVTFSTSLQGGAPGGTLSWSGLPAGCPSGNGPTILCTVAGPATYSIEVTGVDGNGVPFASAPLSFSVHPDPTVDLPVASHTSRDVGQTVSFQAQASNGTGDYARFLWYGLPIGSCSGITTATVVCSLTTAGTYNVSVAVTDTNGMTSLTSGNVTLVVAPALHAAAPELTPARALAGTTVTLQANLTGGAAPVTYTWYGLPPGCAPANRSSLSCTAQANGSFAVWYEATDQNGVSVTSGPALLVISSPPAAPSPIPPTVLGVPPTAGYTLLGTLLLALVLAVVLAVLLVRRPKAGSPPPPSVAEATPPEPSAPSGDGTSPPSGPEAPP